MGQTHGAKSGHEEMPHVPVLLAEVLDALGDVEGQRIVDGTFGAGGYSRGLLEAGANVVAIDRDPHVASYVDALKGDFPDRFSFIAGSFSQLDDLVDFNVDAVVLDIGVSSMQLDQAQRGFSFMRDGPLDMRMSGEGTSAADLVNGLDTTELTNLLFAFGEERKSRRIATAIVAARADAPIETTLELAELIEKTIGRKPGDMHPATRSFQALRIAVNAEFNELVEGLFAAERLLGDGGRLAVVTFHSLEDRIVKRFFAPEKTGPAQSRHLPQREMEEARWTSVAKPKKPSKAELERNPRARSSTLRTARRSSVAARAVNFAGLGVPNAKARGVA